LIPPYEGGRDKEYDRNLSRKGDLLNLSKVFWRYGLKKVIKIDGNKYGK
jgi:hypothetical protein